MDIRIQKLTIQNFKKILDPVVYPFDGANVIIKGDNETGKTTLMDAFMWCLFEKDSAGATKFSWKPLDNEGNEIHNLVTAVELTLLVDGKTRSFKRTVVESYEVNRGDGPSVFKGNDTVPYIDGIQKKAAEFKAAVDALVKEETFKMLTSSSYFNAMPWTKQREILFTLAQSVKDLDVVVKNPEFAGLTNYVINGIAIPDLLNQTLRDKTNLTAQSSNLAKTIEVLKETTYKVPDDYSEMETTKELNKCHARQREIDGLIASNGVDPAAEEMRVAIQDMKGTLRKAQSEKDEILDQAQADLRVAQQKVIAEVRKASQQVSELEESKTNLEVRIDRGMITIKAEKEKKNELIRSFDIEEAKEFTAGKCNYCGQDLPQSKLDELEKKFQLEKASTLARINEDGRNTNTNIAAYEEAIKKFQASLETLKTNLEKANANVADLQMRIRGFDNEQVTADTAKADEKIKSISDRITIMETALEKMESKVRPVEKHDDELNWLNAEISRLNDLQAEWRLRNQNLSRIAATKSELEKITIEFENKKALEKLCGKFITHKAKTLQREINSHFTKIKFRLFNTNINGGVVETCEATIDGVPFSSANNAGRVNAGLDIIKTLQRIYGIQAPIWVDNAESVNEYLDVPSQIIKLYVTKDPKLVVEYEPTFGSIRMYSNVGEAIIEGGSK